MIEFSRSLQELGRASLIQGRQGPSLGDSTRLKSSEDGRGFPRRLLSGVVDTYMTCHPDVTLLVQG